MSTIADAIQDKCLAFGDRVIKLNDYLLEQAVAAHEEYKKSKLQKKGKTSSFLHQTSDIFLIAQVVAKQCSSILPVRTN